MKHLTLENPSSEYLQCKDEILNKKAHGESKTVISTCEEPKCAPETLGFILQLQEHAVLFNSVAEISFSRLYWTFVSKDIMIQGDGNR